MQKNITLFLTTAILAIFFICITTSQAQIKISWDDDPDGDVASYKIFVSADSPDNFTNPPGWYSYTTEFTINNPDLYLEPDTIYYFMVRAYSEYGCESDDSEPVFYFYSSTEISADTSQDNDTDTTAATPSIPPTFSPHFFPINANGGGFYDY